MLVIILGNSITTILALSRTKDGEIEFYRNIDDAFFFFFIIEVIMKIMAVGFVFNKGTNTLK